MQLVVAYDVVDDRRRARLHNLLLGYGNPVQLSVFECIVTDRQAKLLLRRVQAIIHKHDRVRFYALCEECAARTRDGNGRVPSPPDVYVV